MTLKVKNMVCDRCVKVVRDTLHGLGIDKAVVRMGEIELQEEMSDSLFSMLEKALIDEGFEIIKSREEEIVEQIKKSVIELVRSESENSFKLSAYLSEKMKMEYGTLGRIFSLAENRSIEKYYIAQKVEYVKELIDYKNLTFSEITHAAGYSSVAHLSRQFKDVTGMTPSAYRESGTKHRPLDKV